MASVDFDSEKQRFLNYYSDHHALLESGKDTLIALITYILTEENVPLCSLQGRVKDRDEAVKKFVRKYRDGLEKENFPYEIKSYITDLIGVRIIIPYESEIETVATLLAKEFDILGVTDKRKTLESMENNFGYKGLHLDLKFSAGRTAMREYRQYADLQFEVQIRTIIQDAWSVLDHNIKYKKAIPVYLQRRINSLAALFEIADREFLRIRDLIRMEEVKAKTKPNQWLDVFSFVDAIHRLLPGTIVKPKHADFFLDEILEYGDLSYEKFSSIVEQGEAVINRYADDIRLHGGFELRESAYVYVSLLLYWAERDRYRQLLTDSVRLMFDKWCEQNDVPLWREPPSAS